MIVGSITPEVYKRIEEYAARASPAPTTAATEKAVGKSPAIEQIMNLETAGVIASGHQPKSNDSSSIATKTAVAASPAAPAESLR